VIVERITPETAAQFITVEAGHADIGNDEVRAIVRYLLNGFKPILRRVDLIVASAKIKRDNTP